MGFRSRRTRSVQPGQAGHRVERGPLRGQGAWRHHHRLLALAQGILSGKFHDDRALIRKRPGPRRYLPGFRARGLARTQALVDELRRIGREHGTTAAQVALSWLVSFHGDTVVAIPGATRPHHAAEAAGAMALRLSPEQLARLDEVSRAFL